MTDQAHTFLAGVRMKLGSIYEIGVDTRLKTRIVFSGWYGGTRPMLTHPGMGHAFHTGDKVVVVTGDSIYRVEKLTSQDMKAGR